jgi:predicted GIY-YIG superfamily endonuclease
VSPFEPLLDRRDERVYFIQCNASGCIKIGYSRDVVSRVRALNQQSVAGVRLLYSVNANEKDESALHREFREHLTRQNSEWFHPAPALLKKIAYLKARYGSGKHGGYRARRDRNGPLNLTPPTENSEVLLRAVVELLEVVSELLEGRK